MARYSTSATDGKGFGSCMIEVSTRYVASPAVNTVSAKDSSSHGIRRRGLLRATPIRTAAAAESPIRLENTSLYAESVK
jgi:hypothetical protein